jgi:DNA mismatch repair protein MutS
MCGVPHHAVNSYIEKLSEKGYKVAIVEQLEEPGGKKIVHRDVIRIITPGTNIDESYLSDKTNNYIGGLDKYSKGFILSYIDLSTGDTQITSFPANFDLVLSEINKLGIKELVCSNSLNISIKNQLSKIYGILLSINEDTEVESYLDDLTANLGEDLKLSAKRLLSYILKTQKRVLVHLKPFNYYDNQEYLRLDNCFLFNTAYLSLSSYFILAFSSSIHS